MHWDSFACGVSAGAWTVLLCLGVLLWRSRRRPGPGRTCAYCGHRWLPYWWHQFYRCPACDRSTIPPKPTPPHPPRGGSGIVRPPR